MGLNQVEISALLGNNGGNQAKKAGRYQHFSVFINKTRGFWPQALYRCGIRLILFTLTSQIIV